MLYLLPDGILPHCTITSRSHYAREIYSVTNSTGVTQRFSVNHKTSSEQKNRSLFILDQSQMRFKSDWELKNSDSFVLYSFCNWKKNVRWPQLSSLQCKNAAFFLRLGLPFLLICYENGTVRKRFSKSWWHHFNHVIFLSEFSSTTNPDWRSIVAFSNFSSTALVWTKNVWCVLRLKTPFPNSPAVRRGVDEHWERYEDQQEDCILNDTVPWKLCTRLMMLRMMLIVTEHFHLKRSGTDVIYEIPCYHDSNLQIGIMDRKCLEWLTEVVRYYVSSYICSV